MVVLGVGTGTAGTASTWATLSSMASSVSLRVGAVTTTTRHAATSSAAPAAAARGAQEVVDRSRGQRHPAAVAEAPHPDRSLDEPVRQVGQRDRHDDAPDRADDVLEGPRGRSHVLADDDDHRPVPEVDAVRAPPDPGHRLSAQQRRATASRTARSSPVSTPDRQQRGDEDDGRETRQREAAAERQRRVLSEHPEQHGEHGQGRPECRPAPRRARPTHTGPEAGRPRRRRAPPRASVP